MKNVIFTLLCVLMFSCVVDDDTPLNDKLNNYYNIDSISSSYDVNDRQYSTDSLAIDSLSSAYIYKIGMDTNEYYGILLFNNVESVSEIVNDTSIHVCLYTPTIYGGQLTTCNSTITDFSTTIVNDSTLTIEFDSAYVVIPESFKPYLQDSIYYISANLTINTSLK